LRLVVPADDLDAFYLTEEARSHMVRRTSDKPGRLLGQVPVPTGAASAPDGHVALPAAVDRRWPPDGSKVRRSTLSAWA